MRTRRLNLDTFRNILGGARGNFTDWVADRTVRLEFPFRFVSPVVLRARGAVHNATANLVAVRPEHRHCPADYVSTLRISCKEDLLMLPFAGLYLFLDYPD